MSVLPELSAQAAELSAMVEYAKDSVVSKTLLNKKAGTITIFAFDQGQLLSEHTAPYDAVAYVVEGCLELVIGGKCVEARQGCLTVMPANVPHAVKALQPSKMLLIMLRSE